MVLVLGGSDVATVVVIVSDGGWERGVHTLLFSPSSPPFSSPVAFGESLMVVETRAAAARAAAPWLVLVSWWGRGCG